MSLEEIKEKILTELFDKLLSYAESCCASGGGNDGRSGGGQNV